MAAIVLLEDYLPHARMMSDFLRAKGHRVTHAANARDGLVRIWEVKPDVVIVDITLGEDDGIAVLNKARQTGCKARFMILTGHNDVQLAVRAMKSGAEDYFTKPARLEAVDDQIRQYVADAQREKIESERERTASQATSRSQDAQIIPTEVIIDETSSTHPVKASQEEPEPTKKLPQLHIAVSPPPVQPHTLSSQDPYFIEATRIIPRHYL